MGDEFVASRPGGGDDRLAEQHRLGDGPAEAFGTVQGHISVAGGHQTEHRRAVPGLGDHGDARIVVDRRSEFRPTHIVGRLVHRFENEPDARLAGAEGLLKGRQHRLRIFALEIGMPVEHVQKDAVAVRRREPGAIEMADGSSIVTAIGM